MSEEYQTVERNREEGSIGIGAMIVFIALILVAAVASTIIIKTAEELQQNAEQTSSDTRKEISGKINVVQAMVNTSSATDVESMVFTVKVAAGAQNLVTQNINWVLTCGSAAAYGLVGGNLGTSALGGTDAGGATIAKPESQNADNLDGTDYGTGELDAGEVFRFDLIVDGGDCDALAGVSETMLLKIIVTNGGTTVTELKIDSLTAGASVV
jgi:flagellin FlaB